MQLDKICNLLYPYILDWKIKYFDHFISLPWTYNPITVRVTNCFSSNLWPIMLLLFSVKCNYFYCASESDSQTFRYFLLDFYFPFSINGKFLPVRCKVFAMFCHRASRAQESKPQEFQFQLLRRISYFEISFSRIFAQFPPVIIFALICINQPEFRSFWSYKLNHSS